MKTVYPIASRLLNTGRQFHAVQLCIQRRIPGKMSRVLIVGGGAAGMMAGVLLGRKGHDVTILEKNDKPGKKLFITGKGRCNLTNACDREELMSRVVSNPRFMYSAFSTFDQQDVMAFFEAAGVPLKVERGNRVFPVSDHSSDIIKALTRELEKSHVHIRLKTAVDQVIVKDDTVKGVRLADHTVLPADAVIIASGGLSYPSTGSTGDGFRFALETGHRVTDTSPSLVPLLVREAYIKKLMGLSLKNVSLTIRRGRKVLYDDFGEMLFTDRGVSGPMILSASAYVGAELKKGPLDASLDLKPALTREQLDSRILREFEAAPNKQFKNVIGVLFPASLTPVMIELSHIDPDRKINSITREERELLIDLIKGFPFTITGKGDFKEAVITQGGVHVKDIDPKTMESKKVSGLYFIGEVLDVDAVTGGFNLQIAWSTAAAAAEAIC